MSVFGTCHGCGTKDVKLTDEHVPPHRVQKLVDRHYAVINPSGMIEAHKRSQRRLPPSRRFRGGMKVKTLGECCQQLTQHHYGQAFYDWTKQGLELTEKLTGRENRVQASFTIRPLNVIKQIATMALAAANFNPHLNCEFLRRFIQNPDERHLPLAFEFFVYLNPPRKDYELPQSRMETDQLQIDVKKGTLAFLLADIAFPPFGYVVVFGEENAPLLAVVKAMANISHFGHTEYGRPKSVTLDLPVRTPFGPAALRYMQDAVQEQPETEAA